MKKQVATFFLAFSFITRSLFAHHSEVNLSYDYFRGLPDGSWNGNTGAFLSGNFGTDFFRCVGAQAGGSYGLYNWEGRQNLLFENPKAVERQAFVTGGLFSWRGCFSAGIVYDRMFVNHFGIYDADTSFDQLRFRAAYSRCCDEFGVEGTAHLTTATIDALGIPVSFRAIDQLYGFWRHFFGECSQSLVWIGAPYRSSLMYPNRTAGYFVAGVSFRTPLTRCLFLDARGSYMKARHAPGAIQSRNTASSLCIGITYHFGCSGNGPYMPLANNSNFLVDTDFNQ